MKNQKHYENLFANYPDLVRLPDFQRMLGGISEGTARKLLREKRVKSFYIRNTYLIPKIAVVDYLLSEHYAEYRKILKAQV